MLACAGLGWIALHFAHLTGLSGKEPSVLASFGAKTTVSGPILAGAIIGSLGALNDVTITQASAVRELWSSRCR